MIRLRPREPRQKVHVPARMRCGLDWTDIHIKNMSSRGLMAETPSPPGRGTYIEVRRGTRCIVGRVVWAKGNQFGVRSQDIIIIAEIVSEPRLASRPSSPEGKPEERRRDSSRVPSARAVAERAERSRTIGRTLQFCLLIGLGGAGAVFAAVQVYDVLSYSFHAAGRAMAGRGQPGT